MNTQMMLYPLWAQLFLIVIVWSITGVSRFKATNTGKLSLSKLKTMNFSDVDDKLIIPGRNFDNQFQVPILFMFFTLFCIEFSTVDLTFTIASWLFVLSRYIHTYIHLTTNNIKWRFYSFGLGSIIIWVCWFRLGWLIS